MTSILNHDSLIVETIEFAKENNIPINETELNNINIKDVYSDYFGFHSYSVSIQNNKLAIVHLSNNYGELSYTSDLNGNDFTPESVLETIQKTVTAMNEAEKILNNSPLSNFI